MKNQERTPIFAATLETGPKKYLIYLLIAIIVVFFAFPVFRLKRIFSPSLRKYFSPPLLKTSRRF